MDRHLNSFREVVKMPSAFIPLGMSLAALTLMLGSLAMFGVVHDVDEGATAHLWQILMVGQLPVFVFFLIKWLPRAPKPTLYVLSLQVAAALASMAPVFFLHL
jgi:NADH:ubiquinone oxidoreductase subunit H